MTAFLTDRYAVSPQITPEDVPALAAQGFTTVLCNRPDAEVPPQLQAEALRVAVDAAGLSFEVLPLTHQTMTPDNVSRQVEIVAASKGPVLAYCASGTRCSVIWALGQVGEQSVEDILQTTARAGYDLAGLAPTLRAIEAKR